MVLECLGSSSSGNCYLLKAKSETLAVEAGINFKEVKKALDWKLSSVVGCVVSHEHNDHAKYVRDFLQNGIRVLALPDVFRAKGVGNLPFRTEVEPLHGYKVGGFKIFTIPVVHDVPCLAYIIEHEEMGRLIFITDTMMLEYKLPSLDHIMIEANYSDEILDYNIDNGITPASMRERLLHSHMEVKTTANILLSNDISLAKEIILVHLSARNSDSDEFRQIIGKAAGKPVYVAHSGFSINLSKEPY